MWTKNKTQSPNMSRLSFASPLRPKIQNAKRFLSLQVSQASHALSDELSNILKSSKASSKKRRRVIDEIFFTEQSYQEHLHLVTTLFLSPLRELSLLPDHILNSIFSNIEAIQSVSRELLVHMETMGIGDAFLALAPFLKLYSTYANNFEKATNTIKEWEKKCPKFAAFIQQQESLEEAKGLKLNALLITPIQRVPRYKMLLENLLWKTPEGHTELDKVKEAVNQISNVALHINENIRQHENYQKILSIQNSFSREGAPKLIAPGRVFLKEGDLLKVGKRGWRSAKERTFFLFSDILIYAKKNNEKASSRPFLCLQVFPLQQCKVQEVMGDGNNRNGGALFSIDCNEKSLLLFSKSQGEAKSWLNEIRKTIECNQDPCHSFGEGSSRTATCNTSRRVKRAPLARKRKQSSSRHKNAPDLQERSSPKNKSTKSSEDGGFPKYQGDEKDTGESSRSTTPASEASTLTSVHSSSSEEKENNTVDLNSDHSDTKILQHQTGVVAVPERIKITGRKRKLDKTDIAMTSTSDRNKRQKSARLSGLFTCGNRFEQV